MTSVESPLELVQRALGILDDDPEGARRDLERASAGFGAAGDPAGRGECLLELARLAMGNAELDEAQRFAERAADCFSSDDPRRGLAALWAGRIATVRDDEPAAERHLEEAIERTEGELQVQALELRGQLAFDAGELESAEEWYLRAWRVAGPVAEPMALASLRERFAELAWARGRQAEVTAQLDAAVRVLEGLEGGEIRLRRMRLKTDLAEHHASRGRAAEAVACYAEIEDELRAHGLVQRAERLARRRIALTR